MPPIPAKLRPPSKRRSRKDHYEPIGKAEPYSTGERLSRRRRTFHKIIDLRVKSIGTVANYGADRA
jgi:hypothetical protein